MATRMIKDSIPNTMAAHVEETSPGRTLGLVAIVGRPNVGKSTLFNRLTGGKNAIVHNLPGVTRDRNYGEANWHGKSFLLIDTGGFESDPDTDLKKQIQEQSRLAIDEADVIVFLFDGRAGLNPLDWEAVKLLRQVKKPVFFAVNKIDTKTKEPLLYDFFNLGLAELFPVSAEHGIGLGELMDRTMGALSNLDEQRGTDGADSTTLRLAVVGRPNVGKSTLVNRLLGVHRAVVDDQPGTTRDALDSPFTWGSDHYTLVDTAGIRRKARIIDRVERTSVLRSLRSVDRGDVIVHLLDGPEGITTQDAHIMSYAVERGKGLVVAVNKWDLLSEEAKSALTLGETDSDKPAFLDFAPFVSTSALTGHGLPILMDAVKRVASAQQRWVRTSALNQMLGEIVRRHPPPSYRGREVKFYYATQTGICPPTFTLFVNSASGVPVHYERYLIHQLRESLGLENSPIRTQFKNRRESRKGK